MGSISKHITGGGFQGEQALKIEIEILAAAALGITLHKLQKNNRKTWLGLGGDSLTAVNFMGACHEAGIEVNIPDIFKAETVDDLLRRITEGHRQNVQSVSNGTGTDESHNLPQGWQQGISDELRGVLDGFVDEVEGVGPCSPMQENFIAVQSLDPSAYQLQLAVRVASTNPAVVVSVDTARRAWKQVVRRHAALRTSFVESTDRPGRLDQVVWTNPEPQISVLSSPPSNAEKRTAATSFEGYKSRFSHHLILAPAPGARLYLRLVISHALVDGVSIELLFRDLLLALAGLLPVDEQSMKCGDYLEAQQPDTSREALEYWSRYTEAIEGTFLESARLESKTKPTGLYTVDEEVALPPANLADEEDRFDRATLVNACQVAFALVLGSYTGSGNVCFSYTASGRQKRVRGLQGALGNFVNTLPCRVDFRADPTVKEAMLSVQADFLDSLPFQAASLTGKTEAGGPAVQELGDSLLSFQRGLPEEELAQARFAVDVMSWEAPSDVGLTESS